MGLTLLILLKSIVTGQTNITPFAVLEILNSDHVGTANDLRMEAQQLIQQKHGHPTVAQEPN